MSPRFFIDRSLGNDIVPEALRRAGWSLVTMRERYGELTAQQLADVPWILEAARQGDVLLTADKKIAQRPLEARAVVEAGARVFALASNAMTGPQKAERLLAAEQAVFDRVLREQPPYAFSVGSGALVRLALRS